MSKFDPRAFNEFILDSGVIGFYDQPITLKSGRQSYWYVNWRHAAEDAWRMDKLSDFVQAFTNDCLTSKKIKSPPESFYGVPEGATKLGILVQHKWAKDRANYGPGSHALSMGRGKPKEHGLPQDKFFVGVPRGATIILEDVTTTGGSLLRSIDSLLECHVPILAAFGLTNRMEKDDQGHSVEEVVAKKQSAGHSISYFHLSSALDLLPQAIKRLKPPKPVVQAIVEEFVNFGVAPLVV